MEFHVSFVCRHPVRKRVFLKEIFPSYAAALKNCNAHRRMRIAMRIHSPDGTVTPVQVDRVKNRYVSKT